MINPNIRAIVGAAVLQYLLFFSMPADSALPEGLLSKAATAAFFQGYLRDAIKLKTNNERLEVTSTLYCGSLPDNNGKLLLLAKTENDKSSQPAFQIGDCRLPPQTIGQRTIAARSSGPILIAEVRVNWSPWRLSFYIAEAFRFTLGLGSSTNAVKLGQNDFLPLTLKLSTKDFAVDVNGVNQKYSITIEFVPEGTLIKAVQPGAPVEFVDTTEVAALGRMGVNKLPAFGLALVVPYDWIKTISKTRPFKYRTSGDTIEIRELDFVPMRANQPSCAPACPVEKLAVHGEFFVPSVNIPNQTILTFTAPDLAIQDLTISPKTACSPACQNAIAGLTCLLKVSLVGKRLRPEMREPTLIQLFGQKYRVTATTAAALADVKALVFLENLDLSLTP